MVDQDDARKLFVRRIRRIARRLSGRPVHRWQWVPFALAVVAASQSLLFAPAVAASQPVLSLGCALTFLAAAMTHAGMWRTARWSVRFLLVAGGGGLLDVPIIVPIAWTMMAYPAFVVGRRVTPHRMWGPLAATAALVAWDLVLDPVMVRAGLWEWHGNPVTWSGVPLTNFVGWTCTSLCMLWPMWRCHPPVDASAVDDRVPLGLYAGMGLWSVGQAIDAGAIDAAVLGGSVMGGLTWLSVRPRAIPEWFARSGSTALARILPPINLDN